MIQKPTPPGSPKKNRGGRPRKHAKGDSRGNIDITWKQISDPPGSLNHYEISSQGEVRRKLKDGRYAPVKPWTTGGPYAAVYLYGFPNATRHRKKVYIHRLVATHFVKGRKPGEVVHHRKGPANNTASQLEWVSVEENAKARKYFNPDGTRKSKKVKFNVPGKKDPQIKGAQAPKPPKESKDRESVAKLPGKSGENLPDRNEYIPGVSTVPQKIKYVIKNSSEARSAYMKARGVHPDLRSSNIAEKFFEATGKRLTFKKSDGAYAWKTTLISALHSIETRLEKPV